MFLSSHWARIISLSFFCISSFHFSFSFLIFHRTLYHAKSRIFQLPSLRGGGFIMVFFPFFLLCYLYGRCEDMEVFSLSSLISLTLPTTPTILSISLHLPFKPPPFTLYLSLIVIYSPYITSYPLHIVVRPNRPTHHAYHHHIVHIYRFLLNLPFLASFSMFRFSFLSSFSFYLYILS